MTTTMVERTTGTRNGYKSYSCLGLDLFTRCSRIKRINTPMLSFQSFRSASKILKGIEALNMVKKGKIKKLNYSALNEAKYTNQLFGIVL